MFKPFRLFALVALCLLVMVPAAAQDEGPAAYTAPDGSFTAPIPAGWEDQSTDAYGLFVRDDVELYLVSYPVEADTSIQEVIAQGLEMILPDFDAQPVQTSPIPIPNGTWTQNIYTLDGGAIAAALGILRDEQAALIYIEAPSVAALQAATPALNNVLLGLQFSDAVDLSGQEPALFDDAMAAELTAYVESALEQFNILGASVAVVQGGNVAYLRGFGVREPDGEPVNPETLFMIGSTTKSFTTLTLATLVDEGVIDWDTPVVEILPEFAVADPERTEQILVRHLVNNASGVGRNDVRLILFEQTPEEIVASIADLPLVSELGESFNYSNQMVATGGFAAAVAAGADLSDDVMDAYFELVNARVLNPLLMADSTFDFDAAVAQDNVALPYAYETDDDSFEAVSLRMERFVLPLAPAGALWSNAVDMSRYMLMQIANGLTPDGERIVSVENLNATQTTEVTIGGQIGYGMGWIIEDYKGQRMISHGGNTIGFTSEFTFLPDAGIGVLVLANAPGANNFSASVREHVFEQVFGLEHEAGQNYLTVQESLLAQSRAMSESMASTSPDVAAFADFLGEYKEGIVVREAENADAESSILLSGDFIEDMPLFASSQLADNALVTGGFIFRFEEDDNGVRSVNVSLFADPGQTVTLERVAEPGN
jgi:CubicO group peptidase (beta-lactamase class C family)